MYTFWYINVYFWYHFLEMVPSFCPLFGPFLVPFRGHNGYPIIYMLYCMYTTRGEWG